MRLLHFSFLLMALITIAGCTKSAGTASSSTASSTPAQPDPSIPPPRPASERSMLRITIPAMKTAGDFEKIREIFVSDPGLDMVSLMQQQEEGVIDNPNLYIQFYPEFKKEEIFQKIKDAGFPEVSESGVR